MKKETPWTHTEVQMALELAGLYIGKTTKAKRKTSSTEALAKALNEVTRLEAKENDAERKLADEAGSPVKPEGRSPEVATPRLDNAGVTGAKVRNLCDVKSFNGKRH